MAALSVVLHELVHGSTDPAQRTFVLNQGDHGLLASLDRLTAAEASSTDRGTSIASHVDHLRYSFMLLNRWASGTPVSRREIDFTLSWKNPVVTDDGWRELRRALRTELDAWEHVLLRPREIEDLEANYVAGSVAHLAYHLGALRQLATAVRGPTADDEAREQAAFRASRQAR